MAPLTMPPKEVGAVNTIKTDLQKVIEKFSKIGSANSSYMELYDKIRNLLNKLGKLEINVATLHVTKVGKLMTKYERELPKELSDIAKENNTKWKLLLNAYREEFKKKKFVKMNEVPVKEEPLSQDSYNDLIASQESSNEADDSYSLLLASQDFDPSEVETENEFLTSTPMNQGTRSNHSNSDTVQNKAVDVASKGFLIDMRDVVSNLTNSLSSVEGECNRMKTMIEYINDKLNDYEKTLSLQNSVSTSKNNPMKETFEKTGRAVMPCLLKPSPSKNCSETTPISTQSANPLFTPVRVGRIAKETERSKNTKDMSNIQSFHKEKSISKDNSVEKASKSARPHTVSSSKNNKRMNDKSIPDSNIASKSTTFSKTNACVTTACTSTVVSDEVEENEDVNPCTSSADMDQTLPYPLSDITIKYEEPDTEDSQDIEFVRHGGDIVDKSSSKRDHSSCTSENIYVKNTGDLKKCPSQKLKRKSFEDDVVPAKLVSNKEKESIQDKISCISQNLKRRSVEERESCQKVKNNSPERQVFSESTKSHSKSSKFHGDSSRYHSESCNSTGELSKSHGKSSKSTVFDIDSDGFAIPKFVNQNEVQISDNTILLKGDSMDEISELLEGNMLEEDDNECHTEVSESSDENSCLLPSAQNNNPTTNKKRRLTGYASFFRHIMSERVKNGPMVNFSEMSKLAANEWKKLDLDARKEWRIKGWDEKEKLQCDKCQKLFKREKEMKYHWRRCGACACTVDGCTKEFSSLEGLRRHSKIHNKTYICKVCNKSFPSSTALKRHMFIHEGKRFSCSSCPQTYSSKANLLRHIRSVHE